MYQAHVYPLPSLAAIGLLFVSSSVTMAVPFALGRIIDIIYSIDRQDKDSDSDKEQKKKFEKKLKTFCLGLVGVFVLGGEEQF